MNNLDKTEPELASTGYESTDTVQATLYKLANSLFSLPKHSLVVVDEAGMGSYFALQLLENVTCHIIW